MIGVEAGQSAVGDLFLWLVNQIVPDSYGADINDKFKAMGEKIAAMRPGQSGLLALDWNNGNRTILTDVKLSGLLMGQTLHTEAHEIYRAYIEATAFGARKIIERMEEGGIEINEVICTGGLSLKNKVLMQIYADVLGRPMRVSETEQTCAMGAALFGAVAAGYSDLATLQSRVVRYIPEVYEPIAENQAVYNQLFALYDDLHDGFGIKGDTKEYAHVMKQLIAIRDGEELEEKPASAFPEALKQQVVEANQRLVAEGLVSLTWGNVSAIDRESGLVAIKPSGVDYDKLTTDSLVVVNLDGEVVEGSLRPSSDTKTHLELYRKFEAIGSVVHTHSASATAFSQAGKGLPCLGTTHADHFYGEVPVARALTQLEVSEDYEHATGVSIVERFEELGLNPVEVPAVLLKHHAPFTWGASPAKAVDNSVALEMCSKMAIDTYRMNPDAEAIPQHILEQHYLRKHGANAYYGQK
jgi:L-ribulose-5-phosphate 4-epimerase